MRTYTTDYNLKKKREMEKREREMENRERERELFETI